ncbi:hypothetical protein [Bacillus toyonensis]|uniref:hypothetical protein n=1 Tax=Bacillus toyonensis TaxID=155322 RepID=UPI002E241A60|nr:hypothetical protein [Bacillus toyonensis]
MEKDWVSQFNKIWRLWVKKVPCFVDPEIGWAIVVYMKEEGISFIHNNPVDVFIGFLHKNYRLLYLGFAFKEKEIDEGFLSLIAYIAKFEIDVRFYLEDWKVQLELIPMNEFLRSGPAYERAFALLNGMPEEFQRSIEVQEMFMPENLSDEDRLMLYKKQCCDYITRTYKDVVSDIKKYVISDTHVKLQELKQELMAYTDLCSN